MMIIMNILLWLLLYFVIPSYSRCAEEPSVKLERFTKEVLSLYISQTDVGNDNILAIECSEDSTHYYALIYADNIRYSRNEYNDIIYQNYKVIVSGVNIPYMFYGYYPTSPEIKENINEINYDPLIWQICIYKNGKLCPMHTYKVVPENSIDDIILLAEKHLKGIMVESSDLEHIYSNIEVDHPAGFPLGDNELRDIIKTNIRIRSGNLRQFVPVIINLVIDKNGKATISGFLKSSADEEIDKDALRVAEIVCEYQFTPASHRGEKVDVNFALVFLKNDFAEQ